MRRHEPRADIAWLLFRGFVRIGTDEHGERIVVISRPKRGAFRGNGIGSAGYAVEVEILTSSSGVVQGCQVFWDNVGQGSP